VNPLTILLFGTFDHLHPGHAFVMGEALRRGNVTVIVARDRNVKRIKGRLPDQLEGERVHAIAKAFPSTRVVLGDEKDFLQPILEHHPDLILLGYDQQLPGSISEEQLKRMGIAIERLPAYEPEKHKSSLRR